MNKEKPSKLIAAIILLMAFAAWTMIVRSFDLRPIGPLGSAVGLAGLNAYVHALTGVHMALYHITDWLGLVPIAFAAGFALLGLSQWINRRQLRMVDSDILVLGAFYILVMAAYVLFELFAVNFRTVLIDGILETSYPSSTTMLVLCVMPTAAMQLNERINSPCLRHICICLIAIFTAFMVIARLISGVHWLSDIIGGVLLSSGLLLAYAAFTDILRRR